MSRKFGLGKGLDSLLPTEAPVEKPAAAVKLSDKISINQLKPNKEQPRKYYLGSSLVIGQIEGIAVDESGIYISGEEFRTALGTAKQTFYFVPADKVK